MQAPREKLAPPSWILLVLGSLFILPRLYHIGYGYVSVDEWGHAQFLIYARNYVELGLKATRLLPVFGVVGGHLQAYTHHPFLADLLLGGWFWVFGSSVLSARAFAIFLSACNAIMIFWLADRLWGRRAASYSAFFYCVMPLSIYIGRLYCMEVPMQTFVLAACVCGNKWQRSQSTGWLAAAALCLALGEQCDYYVVFLVPYFLWLAWRWRRPALLVLAGAPVVSLLVFFGYMDWVIGLRELMRGASKYETLRQFSPAALWAVGRRLVLLNGVVPPILAVWALVRAERKTLVWPAVLVVLACLDGLITFRALVIHTYRVLFFLAPSALLAGYAVSRLSRAVAVSIAALTLAVGLAVTPPLFKPTNPKDVVTARIIRAHTTDRDLLIGLPPDIAYYLHRIAVVPYYYLWAGRHYYANSQQVLDRLAVFAKYHQYDRIILFRQFLLAPGSVDFPVDFSKAFRKYPFWVLANRPDQDPLIWKHRGHEASVR